MAVYCNGNATKILRPNRKHGSNGGYWDPAVNGQSFCELRAVSGANACGIVCATALPLNLKRLRDTIARGMPVKRHCQHSFIFLICDLGT